MKRKLGDKEMKKIIIIVLVLSLILAVPSGNIAYARETYVEKTEFDASEFILGLLMEGAGIYVFFFLSKIEATNLHTSKTIEQFCDSSSEIDDVDDKNDKKGV